MGIEVPGKRYGKRLQRSKVFGHGGHGKKGVFADLLITPLVDMFVIIVLFLIANFSATGEILNMTKDIQLPSASHVKEIDLVPVVQISSDFVVVSGSVVGKVPELIKDPGMEIPQLTEKLQELKNQTEQLHKLAQDDAKPTEDVNIQAHKEVTFAIIKRVMFSCATAGFGNINFAVLQVGGPDDKGANGPTASATP
jgi:biopolymer transport protein ExbD